MKEVVMLPCLKEAARVESVFSALPMRSTGALIHDLNTKAPPPTIAATIPIHIMARAHGVCEAAGGGLLAGGAAWSDICILYRSWPRFASGKSTMRSATDTRGPQFLP